MGVERSHAQSVSSFHETTIGQPAQTPLAAKTLTPLEKKLQAQASVLSKKMEAKLDRLSGKNVQTMNTKELTAHMKKCDKTASKLHKLASKNLQLSQSLKESDSVKEFQKHAGDVILAGQKSIKGHNLSMKAFEKSSRLEAKMEVVQEALSKGSEATSQTLPPLSEQEMKELVNKLQDVDQATPEDLTKFEQLFSSKPHMEQLNGYLRAQSAEELGISGEIKGRLEELTYIACHLPDHKQILEGLHQKLTDPDIPRDQRTLSAREAWLLDHIGNANKHFSKMDQSILSPYPLLSKLGDSAFSHDNIERIAKHRSQNLKVGDLLLFSGAKYRSYKGHTKDTEDAMQIRLTGSETVHAEVIHTKTKEGHAVNQGLWDSGLLTESTDVGISYFSDGYRLNPENLLTSEAREALKEAGVTDIKSFMEDRYAQAFTKATNEERNDHLVNSVGRRIRSILPRLFNKRKQTIDDMTQTEQRKAICSEYAIIVTFRAIKDLNEDLASFCKEKGVGQRLSEDSLLSFDTSQKMDSAKLHTGKLSKMLEGMLALGLVEPVAKTDTALPLQMQEIVKIRGEVFPDSTKLDRQLAEVSVAHKNLHTDDPRRAVLDARIQEAKQAALQMLGEMETVSRQRVQSAKEKHPEELELNAMSRELEADISTLKQKIAMLEAMEGTTRTSSLSDKQKAVYEAVKKGNFEEYAPLVNAMAAKELKEIVREHALASLEGKDKPELTVPGLINTLTRAINVNDKERQAEFINVRDDPLVKLNSEANSIYSKSYRNASENAELREKTFQEAKQSFGLTLNAAIEVFGVDKAIVEEINQFIETSLKEIDEAPANQKGELIKKHGAVLMQKMSIFNQQISNKLKGADNDQKDAWQKEIQDKLPVYKDKKYQGTSKDHSIVIIAAQWKMPTFIDTFYSTLSDSIKAQQELQNSDPTQIGLSKRNPSAA